MSGSPSGREGAEPDVSAVTAVAIGALIGLVVIEALVFATLEGQEEPENPILVLGLTGILAGSWLGYGIHAVRYRRHRGHSLRRSLIMGGLAGACVGLLVSLMTPWQARLADAGVGVVGGTTTLGAAIGAALAGAAHLIARAVTGSPPERAPTRPFP